MSRIISVHSFRGGTGKSNATANLASALARAGLNVGVVDADMQSPGMHVLFGLDLGAVEHTLNDYLWGRCRIEDCAHDVGRTRGAEIAGKLFVIPSSMSTAEITRVLRDGYDVARLNDGLHDLIDSLDLDALFIDTHPGIDEETLSSIAISDALVIIMRPDQQDYEGTGVAVAVARSLEVPRMLLVVNKTPASLDIEGVRHRVAETYRCEVAAVIPHSEALMNLASDGVLVLESPQDPVSLQFIGIARRLLDG